jgi:hypothetical protein
MTPHAPVPGRVAFGLSVLLSAFPGLAAGQILETETARLVPRGAFEIGSNFEYQVSSDGSEAALPFAFVYGVSRHLELLIEPVPYTGIRPHSGPGASGVGDLEATLTFLGRTETARVPAIALAGEVKFPTARNTLIGTGRTDYAAYLIASKRLAGARLDTHANIGYTVVGRPAGAQLKNVFNFALGWEWRLGSTSELYGELLANTAASSVGDPGGPTPPGTAAPEAPSGEIVGSIGVARYVKSSMRLSCGISLDNNAALLLRPGMTLRLR